MADFIFNIHSSESRNSQFSKYVQQASLFDDVTSAVKRLSQDTKETLQYISEEQIEAMRSTSEIVCGSIEDGFNQLSSYAKDINASIQEVGALLDWRTSLLIEEQRITNLLTENIALLLRIPDFQKERQYYIKQGMKHLKNAIIDNDLFRDALDNLIKAEQLEKTDYVVLHYIGFIYLRGTQTINFQKAEEYLRKAAKYAIVESDPHADRLVNILAGNVKNELSEMTSQPETIKRVAADSYYLASIACYLQNKYGEAAELASKAFILAPNFFEAAYTQAKALAAYGNDQLAANVLEGIIRKDRTYSIKTTTDTVLAPSKQIQAILQKLRDEVVNNASERLETCKSKVITKSLAIPLLSDIEILINKRTYLDGMKALDELTRKRKWINVEESAEKPADDSILSKAEIMLKGIRDRAGTKAPDELAQKQRWFDIEESVEDFVCTEKSKLELAKQTVHEYRTRVSKKSLADQIIIEYEKHIEGDTYKDAVFVLNDIELKKEWEIQTWTYQSVERPCSLDSCTQTQNIQFSPDGNILAIAHYGENGYKLTFFETELWTEKISFSSEATGIYFYRENQFVYFYGYERIGVVNLNKNTLQYIDNSKSIRCTSSDKSKFVIGGGRDFSIKDIKTSNELFNLKIEKDFGDFCPRALSMDGKRLALSYGSTLLLFDTTTKSQKSSIDYFAEGRSLIFSLDGRFLVGLIGDSYRLEALMSWDADSGKRLWNNKLGEYFSDNESLLLTVDGKFIIYNTKYGIELVHIKTGIQINLLRNHYGCNSNISLSPDQSLLIEADTFRTSLYMAFLNPQKIKIFVRLKEFIEFESDYLKLTDSVKGGIKRNEERENKRKAKAQEAFERALEEEHKIDRKWFSKDYKLALTLYEESIKLGNKEAKKKLDELKNKLSIMS